MSFARLARCLIIDDLRAAARARAHRMVFDYIDGGADDERTLQRNQDAFREYELLFRVLVGVDQIDTSTTLLGHKIRYPFFTAPSAGNRLFHTAGERAVASAAADAGVIYCLSTLSSVSIEEIGALTAGPKWFQLYVWKDRGLIREMLGRARAAGFSALVLTVDFPVTGNRERDPRNGFTIPPKHGLGQVWEALKRPAWTWDYLTSPPIRYANLSAATPATSPARFVATNWTPALAGLMRNGCSESGMGPVSSKVWPVPMTPCGPCRPGSMRSWCPTTVAARSTVRRPLLIFWKAS